jgi:hypothetical protein
MIANLSEPDTGAAAPSAFQMLLLVFSARVVLQTWVGEVEVNFDKAVLGGGGTEGVGDPDGVAAWSHAHEDATRSAIW